MSTVTTTTHAADKNTGMTASELRDALDCTQDRGSSITVTTSWSGKIRTITITETDPE